jgi:hypothetical protein
MYTGSWRRVRLRGPGESCPFKMLPKSLALVYTLVLASSKRRIQARCKKVIVKFMIKKGI